MPRARRALLLAPAAVVLLLGACSASIEQGHGSTTLSPVPGAPSPSSSSGGISSPPSASVTVPAEPAANFIDCTDEIPRSELGLPPGRESVLRFGCAEISVPLDYADPTGKKITLALIKIHDTNDTHPIGSLLLDPGGPGASGVNFALGIVGELSDKLLDHFDILGFDPRGAAESTPVDCTSDQQEDATVAASPNPLTAAGFAEEKSLASDFARRCDAKYGSSLSEYNTVQTAKDMDEIRQAVGDAQMNYLGFSYGTELGAQYVHLFPGRVRVAVLDGAVDPLKDLFTGYTAQTEGFELAFDQFAIWCRTHAPCSTLGNARQAVYRIVAQARKAPIPSSDSSDPRKATTSLVLTGVAQALYSKSLWPQLASAISAGLTGDAKGLLALADQYNERFNGHYTNVLDAYNTIECNDTAPGLTDATIRATVRVWTERFPMFGAAFASELFTCEPWQPKRTVPGLPTAPTTPHKVLVIGNLHDPATPYQGAKDLTATLGNARLLTWDGEGHTSYLQGSTCVDNYVNDYLVNLTLPPSGTTCPR